MTEPRALRLGLGPNLAQFSLLVVVNAFVGAMVGLERTILPAIAVHDFHLAARAAVLSSIAVFGVTKAQEALREQAIVTCRATGCVAGSTREARRAGSRPRT